MDAAIKHSSSGIGIGLASRNIRAVGKAYKALIHNWREVLPTQSICLRVPIDQEPGR